MTLDADHRMYDYKLRHAMHLDRRNITQVHADDFEISDRIFDAFSMLNEADISLSRTWTNIAPFGHKVPCAILAFPRST